MQLLFYNMLSSFNSWPLNLIWSFNSMSLLLIACAHLSIQLLFFFFGQRRNRFCPCVTYCIRRGWTQLDLNVHYLYDSLTGLNCPFWKEMALSPSCCWISMTNYLPSNHSATIQLLPNWLLILSDHILSLF